MFGTGGFLNPKQLLSGLKIIKSGFYVADFGCGSGYFTLPLAELVGKEGQVTAVDVLENVLQLIQKRAESNGIFNIKTVHANLEKERGSNLRETSQDIVFLANILFQSKEKEAILKEAVRVLKPGGKMIVIDWLPDNYFTTDKGWRISPEELKKMTSKLELRFEEAFQPDSYHYGLIYTKK
jgi:ubiquinone/menaquinone biosynthesis C-methylase UbiE